MRTAACLILIAALAPALIAQDDPTDGLTVTVKPIVEGKAEPGKEYTLKLEFDVPEGYHAYHKDNPGYSLPVNVRWTELSGLELVSETWPEPHKHVDEFSEEWELGPVFNIAYTFKVPADAKGNLTVSGNHETQFCNEDGCLQAKSNFTTQIEVSETATTSPEPTAEGLPHVKATLTSGTALAGGVATVKLTFEFTKGYHAYHKDNPGYGLAPDIKWTELSGMTLKDETWPEPHKNLIEEDWEEWEYSDSLTLTYSFDVPKDATGTLDLEGKYSVQVCDEAACFMRKGDFATSVTVGTSAPDTKRDATDKHGFYLDFDYAMQKAKESGKPLLVDFNGENCRPCRIMEAKVFTLPAVEHLLKEFVVVSVKNDVGDARYNELWEKYQPTPGAGVPYYAVMDHDGNVVRGIASTLPAETNGYKFEAFLKGEVVEDDTTNVSLPPTTTETNSDSWPEGLYGPPTTPLAKGFEFEAKFSTNKLKPGGEVTLELHFKLKNNDKGEPYHLHHPTTTATAIPLNIALKGSEGLTPVGEWEFPAYTEHYDDILEEMNRYLLGDVVVVHKFKVPDDATPGKYRAFGLVGGQFCDDMGCINFDRNDPDTLDRKFGWVASIEIAADGADNATTTASASGGHGEAKDEKTGDDSLIWFLLVAFGAGVITLLTPCVLPVLPLTVGFFVSQSAKGKSPLLTAAIYCACIVATFTIFGLVTSLTLGATGAQNISTNGYVNTFLAVMFAIFALSFLGMFELRVPAFITQWFNRKQVDAQKEGNGYTKAFFSGAAFSLISFSCTGPIAGTFLAQAAGGSVWVPTMAMVAFSTGMALPIFVLGQFPSLMKKMPKSGGWMNAMKVVFGFIEIGLAIMYLSAAEQAFRSIEAAEWVSRYVVIGVWAASSLAITGYLFGFFRLPHDHEETKQIGVMRSVLAVGFLAFALYMLPGLFGAKYGNVLEGILPPPPRDGGIQLSMGGGAKANDHHDLPWHKDFDEGLAAAKAADKPVFLDFTGYN